MATIPRISDRARRFEQVSSLPAMLRALSDPMVSLPDVACREIQTATADAAGRIALHGPHQCAVTMPLTLLARDLSATGGTASGGALVGVGRIDAQSSLRPFSAVADAGLRVVDVPAGEGDAGAPTISEPPAAGWAASEGAVVPTSDAVFGLGQPIPRRLGLQFFVSWRLLKQGGALFDDLIRTEIGHAIGRGIDAAVLGGSGSSGEPQGLATMSGINSTAGASLAHAGLLAMRKGSVAGGAREDQLRWIGTPTVQETLGARERSSGGGRYLWDDGDILGRSAHATASAPSGTLICGDFSLVTLYVFGGLDLIFDRRSLATGGKVSVVASLYCDVTVTRPAAFSVAASIT